ncbi:MAG: GNAT family N-acetyltransferase [Phycisphaerales bacterium]|jgi:GNAT superfamily N-acetyltransferase|nr:GNAT family N-acetyltransferase [Phycisphaerales bacterium]
MLTPMVVPPERYEEALRCLFPSGVRPRPLLERLRAGQLGTGGLHGLERPKGGLVAAALLVPAPGRTATVLATQPSPQVPPNAVATVIQAAARGCRDIDLLQGLLRPEDAPSLAAFQAAGFQSLTILHTMTCAVPKRPAAADLPPGISLVTTTDDMLVQTLDATYEQTRDCPGLCGLRNTRDIISGHRAGGVVHDELWLAVRLRDETIGCVLCTCGASHMGDLAYLGLTPAYRGLGLGRAILRDAMRRLARRGVTTLRLAVDSRNDPALKLYRAIGFTTRATQQAVIRSTREVQGE